MDANENLAGRATTIRDNSCSQANDVRPLVVAGVRDHGRSADDLEVRVDVRRVRTGSTFLRMVVRRRP